MVVLGCGGFGFGMAASLRREIRILTSLRQVLEQLESELDYRQTPLPGLCSIASQICTGALKQVFRELSEELQQQRSPDAASCMEVALGKGKELPQSAEGILRMLGRSLGCFDLAGQLKEIAAVKRECDITLETLRQRREERLRSYQTLGLCAGAALAILLI